MRYLGRIEENNVFFFYSYNSPQSTQLDAKIPGFFSQEQVVLVHTLKASPQLKMSSSAWVSVSCPSPNSVKTMKWEIVLLKDRGYKRAFNKYLEENGEWEPGGGWHSSWSGGSQYTEEGGYGQQDSGGFLDCEGTGQRLQQDCCQSETAYREVSAHPTLAPTSPSRLIWSCSLFLQFVVIS